ncbi:MAG TPA: ASCH domain-containing protein [Rubrobacter sp.]
MDDDRLEAYWSGYLETLPAGSPMRDEQYVAEGWGDSPRLADELGTLIVTGAKTATCSALWEYEAEGSALPEAGSKTIVLDGQDDPLCIVETTEVVVRPYDEVDAKFAYEEGEGHRSLEYWRAAHWRFFSRTLPTIGKEPSVDMPLVCERFRVIYE